MDVSKCDSFRYINTRLLKICSESKKFFKVAKIENKCSKCQESLKSCQAQSILAFTHSDEGLQSETSVFFKKISHSLRCR